jgi:hypothetical protein
VILDQDQLIIQDLQLNMQLIIKQKIFYNFISEIKFEFKIWNRIYNFIEFNQVCTISRSSNLIWNLN